MTLELLHHRFIQNNWTLALAESCTGGGLAARFVSIPDCSLYFQGAIVAYSNRSKEKNLYVKPRTIENYGAVSEQTALEMALGALKQFESRFALSTTGVAGPSGGRAKKPVGTVCFAIVSSDREPLLWTSHFKGDRASVIDQAIMDALENLRDYTL
ncbi:MAG: CinA family protein [Chlamydiales bacterium]|nr:CinA family protein [Chlamydiales bacterium]